MHVGLLPQCQSTWNWIYLPPEPKYMITRANPYWSDTPMVMLGIDALYKLDTCPSANPLETWVICHPSQSNWSPAPTLIGQIHPWLWLALMLYTCWTLAPVSIHLKLELSATRAKVTDHPRQPLLVIYTHGYDWHRCSMHAGHLPQCQSTFNWSYLTELLSDAEERALGKVKSRSGITESFQHV